MLGGMKVQRLVPWAIFGMLAMISGDVTASAQDQAQLVITPTSGHPDDPFYVAGHGFPAGQPLQVTMYCPDWYHNTYGRWSWPPLRARPPIRADKNGNFVAVKLFVPTPLLVKGTPCVLRAPVNENPYEVGAVFTVLSPDQPGPEPTIDLKVGVRLKQSQGKIFEVVDVESAPGANVRVTESYPSGAMVRRSMQLPWTGQRVAHWMVPARVGLRGKVQLKAQARLGTLVGHFTTAYVISR